MPKRRRTHTLWIDFEATDGLFGSHDDFDLRNTIEDKVRKVLKRRGAWTGHGQGMGELDTSFRIEPAVVDEILPLLTWPEGKTVRVRVSRIEGFRRKDVKYIPERWLIRSADGTWSDDSVEAKMAQQEKDRLDLMGRIADRMEEQS